jgi:hypothetical protein
MRSRTHRSVAGLLVGSALLLSVVAPVAASSGVSVDLGRIEITQQLSPGASYTLPTLGVRNPGTERTSYVMVASPVQSDGGAIPGRGWFTFEPATLTLEPGEVQKVRIRLVLPTDAAAGDYTVLVGAQIATPGEGASVGAAAAARTTFTIQPSSGLQAFTTQLGQAFQDLLPWSILVPALVVLGLAAWFLRRRFTFRIGIERRDLSPP